MILGLFPVGPHAKLGTAPNYLWRVCSAHFVVGAVYEFVQQVSPSKVKVASSRLLVKWCLFWRQPYVYHFLYGWWLAAAGGIRQSRDTHKVPTNH